MAGLFRESDMQVLALSCALFAAIGGGSAEESRVASSGTTWNTVTSARARAQFSARDAARELRSAPPRPIHLQHHDYVLV